MIRNLIETARQTGVPVDRLAADNLESWLTLRGKDFPFASGEKASEIKRFNTEARQELEERGFVIYELAGTESIESLIEQGFHFWTTWHRDFPGVEGRTARASEVAIDPKPGKFFLPNSYSKTLDQQLQMIADFSRKLKIEGAKAEMGEVGDYVGVVDKHLKATCNRLFGENYNNDYARTTTPTVGSSVALVGCFGAVSGLRVRGYDRDLRSSDVWAAPLVVPA